MKNTIQLSFAFHMKVGIKRYTLINTEENIDKNSRG